jgi:hypothetical protein
MVKEIGKFLKVLTVSLVVFFGLLFIFFYLIFRVVGSLLRESFGSFGLAGDIFLYIFFLFIVFFISGAGCFLLARRMLRAE